MCIYGDSEEGGRDVSYCRATLCTALVELKCRHEYSRTDVLVRIKLSR